MKIHENMGRARMGAEFAFTGFPAMTPAARETYEQVRGVLGRLSSKEAEVVLLYLCVDHNAKHPEAS